MYYKIEEGGCHPPPHTHKHTNTVDRSFKEGVAGPMLFSPKWVATTIEKKIKVTEF